MNTTARFAALAAALMIAGASAPALADEQIEKPAAAAEKPTVETPIEKLMANEKTAAVLQKHLPNIDQHPAYGQFKGMSLVALKPWSAGAVTDEIIEKVKADLEKLA